MARNNRAKRAKHQLSKRMRETVDQYMKESLFVDVDRLVDDILDVCFIAFASELTKSPYNWDKVKWLRLKTKVDRTISGLVNYRISQEEMFMKLREKDLKVADVVGVDYDDVIEYFKKLEEDYRCTKN